MFLTIRADVENTNQPSWNPPATPGSRSAAAAQPNGSERARALPSCGSKLRMDPRRPSPLAQTAPRGATHTVPVLAFTTKSTGSERKQKEGEKVLGWKQQVQNTVFGRDRIRRQRGSPGAAGSLLSCQCFPSLHNTTSGFALPASKADLLLHGPPRPLKGPHRAPQRVGLTRPAATRVPQQHCGGNPGGKRKTKNLVG